MLEITDFIEGLRLFLTVPNLLGILLGVVVGIPLGAVPGVTGTMAVAFLLPLTFYLNPIMSIGLLMAVSKGAIYGGSISAILLNIPGTPANTPTAIEGYELTKKGQSEKALKAALYSSTIGDFFSDVVLLLVAAPIAYIALKFGPAEYAMVVLFSIVVVSMMTSGEPFKGIISAGLGLLFSTVGLDPNLSSRRFVFDITELDAGIGLLPMLVGLLAAAEIFHQLEMPYKDLTKFTLFKDKDREANGLSIAEFKSMLGNIFRGTSIGTAIGSLPGIGADVAAFTSYAVAKKVSKKPEKFGKGSLEGIAACESANNATCGANLIPLFTLAIPGNATAAMILGALMIHGLTPSPFLMQENGPTIYGVIVALLIANFFVLVIGSLYTKVASYILKISWPITISTILLTCVAGSYAFNTSLFDVQVMIIFGVIGYFMRKFGLPVATLFISFVLGNMFESKITQSLSISGGDVTIFFTHPIALAFFILTIISVVFLLVSNKGKSKKNN